MCFVERFGANGYIVYIITFKQNHDDKLKESEPESDDEEDIDVNANLCDSDESDRSPNHSRSNTGSYSISDISLLTQNHNKQAMGDVDALVEQHDHFDDQKESTSPSNKYSYHIINYPFRNNMKESVVIENYSQYYVEPSDATSRHNRSNSVSSMASLNSVADILLPTSPKKKNESSFQAPLVMIPDGSESDCDDMIDID